MPAWAYMQVGRKGEKGPNSLLVEKGEAVLKLVELPGPFAAVENLAPTLQSGERKARDRSFAGMQ